MQQTEIGEFSVSIDGNDFNFSPTLRNIAKIADSKRILSIYNMIHSMQVPVWLKLDLARNILMCCCDDKGIEKHLIKTRHMKPHINQHSISVNDQIVVAAALLRHGVSGVNSPDYEGSKKARGKEAIDFNVHNIASQAIVHFNMSENDAMNLTMSKFRYLLAAKFPSEATQNRQDAPSLDAHKEAMKAAIAEQEAKAKRIAEGKIK